MDSTIAGTVNAVSNCRFLLLNTIPHMRKQSELLLLTDLK